MYDMTDTAILIEPLPVLMGCGSMGSIGVCAACSAKYPSDNQLEGYNQNE